MKINKDKIETFGAVLSVVFVISLFVIPIFTSNNREKKDKEIIRNGKFTIGFVYETENGGRGVSSAIYRYFDPNEKKNYSYKTANYDPLLKFYKVYYLPNDKNKSVVDFSHEIPIDSVQYYFPKEQNPFKEEIEAIKEGRYKVSGGF
jgi:hypothetical protein